MQTQERFVWGAFGGTQNTVCKPLRMALHTLSYTKLSSRCESCTHLHLTDQFTLQRQRPNLFGPVQGQGNTFKRIKGIARWVGECPTPQPQELSYLLFSATWPPQYRNGAATAQRSSFQHLPRSSTEGCTLKSSNLNCAITATHHENNLGQVPTYVTPAPLCCSDRWPPRV